MKLPTRTVGLALVCVALAGLAFTFFGRWAAGASRFHHAIRYWPSS
jgi:hypothetical protein